MPSDLPIDGNPASILRVWLFRDVADASSLRARVIAGQVKPEMAFLNAAMIPDVFILRLAAFAAATATAAGRARTRSPYTELVVCMSGGKNISAALATFGLADTTRHVLVARFVGENDKEGGDDGTAQVVAAVGKAATLLPLDALPTLADPAAQASAYGVGPGEVGPLADAVATRIGVRECG